MKSNKLITKEEKVMLCYSFSEKFIDLVIKVENGEITEEEFETLAETLVSEKELPETLECKSSFCCKLSMGII